MIDREHTLPISRQAKALGISRGHCLLPTQAGQPEAPDLDDRIKQLHLELPFAGARMARDLLRQEGHKLGRVNAEVILPISAEVEFPTPG